MADLSTFPDEIPISDGLGNCEGSTITRLRIPDLLDEDNCIRQNAATIPVIIERPENHRIPGGKVTYLDGHTEFVEYPGKFPMTRRFVEELLRLDRELSSENDEIPIASIQ